MVVVQSAAAGEIVCCWSWCNQLQLARSYAAAGSRAQRVLLTGPRRLQHAACCSAVIVASCSPCPAALHRCSACPAGPAGLLCALAAVVVTPAPCGVCPGALSCGNACGAVCPWLDWLLLPAVCRVPRKSQQCCEKDLQAAAAPGHKQKRGALWAAVA